MTALMEADHIKYDLMGMRGSLNRAIEQMDKLDQMFKDIRNVRYFLYVGFDRTESFGWSIEVNLWLDLKDGDHLWIKIAEQWYGKENAPAEVLQKIQPMIKEYNIKDVDFEPDKWVWVQDTKFEGRLSYWMVKE